MELFVRSGNGRWWWLWFRLGGRSPGLATPEPHNSIYDDRPDCAYKTIIKTKKKNIFLDTGALGQVTELFAGSGNGRWWRSSVSSGGILRRNVGRSLTTAATNYKILQKKR